MFFLSERNLHFGEVLLYCNYHWFSNCSLHNKDGLVRSVSWRSPEIDQSRLRKWFDIVQNSSKSFAIVQNFSENCNLVDRTCYLKHIEYRIKNYSMILILYQLASDKQFWYWHILQGSWHTLDISKTSPPLTEYGYYQTSVRSPDFSLGTRSWLCFTPVTTTTRRTRRTSTPTKIYQKGVY